MVQSCDFLCSLNVNLHLPVSWYGVPHRMLTQMYFLCFRILLFLQIPICFRFLLYVLYRVILPWHLTFFLITCSTLSLIWRYFILSSWYLYQVKSTVRIDLSLESLLWYLEWAIKLGTNVPRAHSLSSQYPCHLARMSEQVACTLSWSAYSSTN